MSQNGKLLGLERFETSEHNLREHVGNLEAKEVQLTIESAPLARWAAGVLRPLVTRLVICDPRRNRLISCNPDKDDEIDAEDLCRLLRLGELKEVWISDDEGRQVLREAVYDLLKMRNQQRELKTLIKNRYRGFGILKLGGKELFHPEKRQRWIEKIPKSRLHGLLATYELFDTSLGLWTEQLAEVNRLGRAFPEIERFQEVPGVGEIGSAVFAAFIEDPHRFQRASQIYRYSRLSITNRRSDGKPLGYERLDRRGHGELKNMSYHAWRTGIRAGKQSDVIRRFYLASKERAGTARHGRLNTQRKILKTLWLMWKNGTHFDPDYFLQNPTPEPEKRPRRRRRSRRTRSGKG